MIEPSGQAYASLVISELLQTELEVSPEERMEPGHLKCLIELVKEAANYHWDAYVMGQRDSYKFTEDEWAALWEKAGMQYVDDILNGLVDKGIAQVSIGKDGDFLYGLTEKGKQVAESYTKPKKTRKKAKKINNDEKE